MSSAASRNHEAEADLLVVELEAPRFDVPVCRPTSSLKSSRLPRMACDARRDGHRARHPCREERRFPDELVYVHRDELTLRRELRGDRFAIGDAGDGEPFSDPDRSRAGSPGIPPA